MNADLHSDPRSSACIRGLLNKGLCTFPFQNLDGRPNMRRSDWPFPQLT